MVVNNRRQRIDALVHDYHAYNSEIERTRIRASSMAREKTWTLERLREMLSVAEIADELGVTPAAVYAGLSGEQPEHDADELPILVARLKEIGAQAQRVADGKSVLISPNPVGMQMLAENLKWATEWLEELGDLTETEDGR